jgi:hypothetical protein
VLWQAGATVHRLIVGPHKIKTKYKSLSLVDKYYKYGFDYSETGIDRMVDTIEG